MASADFFEEPAAGGNVAEFAVSELSARLPHHRGCRCGVRGEISGFKRAASGHLYFALKGSKSADRRRSLRTAGAGLPA
ncbi:MAG: exodeoxyribonuclease VII large subunit [Alphaproteobacteria bacterium]